MIKLISSEVGFGWYADQNELTRGDLAEFPRLPLRASLSGSNECFLPRFWYTNSCKCGGWLQADQEKGTALFVWTLGPSMVQTMWYKKRGNFLMIVYRPLGALGEGCLEFVPSLLRFLSLFTFHSSQLWKEYFEITLLVISAIIVYIFW
jgi:hypothetical protein